MVMEIRNLIPRLTCFRSWAGGNKGRPIDAGVLVASHRDVIFGATDGVSRKDLHARLKAGTLHVPWLREGKAGFLPLGGNRNENPFVKA